MKDIVTKSAAAGYICEVELRSSTTGALVPSKVYTDITCKYVRQGCASVNSTNRYAAAAENTAHGTAVQDDDSAWAWIESGIAGVYHFYAPNDCFKTGVNNVKIVLTCTGCIERIINISLIDANLRDAVHLGITGIPNAAAGAASGLAIVGSNMGTVSSVTGNVGGSVASVAAGVTLAASQHVIVDSGTVTTLTNLPAITAGWLTATGIAASALNGKGDWNVGKTGYTVSTVSDKTGYSLANASIVTATFGTCDFTATMKTSLNAATPSVTVSDKTGFSLVNGSIVTATFGTCDFTSTMKTSLNAATPSVTVSDKTGFSLVNGSIVTATFGTCDFTATMKTSLNAATPAVTVSDKTGFSLVNGSIVTATFGTCDFTATMKTSLNAATPSVSVSLTEQDIADIAEGIITNLPTAVNVTSDSENISIS